MVPSNLIWEDPKFVKSGHALVFGSSTADSRVIWTDNVSLTGAVVVGAAVNYNAREIRVNDNINSTGDSARITGALTGTVYNDLLKTGPGTLELTSQASSYGGSTIIQEGTLLVNGTITNSSLTQTRAGAALGGRGTVGAVRVEALGTITPGDTAGHTSVLATKDLSFFGGTAKLALEIGGTTAGGNGTTGYDQISVTGGVSLNGAQLQGTLLNNFAPGGSDLFFIILNDGNDAVQGVFAQGSQVTMGTQTFDISYNADSGSNQFSVAGGNDVALRLVPEPGAGLLALTGAAAMLGVRRRRG